MRYVYGKYEETKLWISEYAWNQQLHHPNWLAVCGFAMHTLFTCLLFIVDQPRNDKTSFKWRKESTLSRRRSMCVWQSNFIIRTKRLYKTWHFFFFQINKSEQQKPISIDSSTCKLSWASTKQMFTLSFLINIDQLEKSYSAQSINMTQNTQRPKWADGPEKEMWRHYDGYIVLVALKIVGFSQFFFFWSFHSVYIFLLDVW